MAGEPVGASQSARRPGGLSPDEFSSAVTAITSAFGDPTRRSIYLLAHERPDGVTASEVAERFALHANVARHHLDKLAAGGYLEVRLGRSGSGAGRPSKRYATTGPEVALDVAVGHDGLVVALLVKALELLSPDVAGAMAEEVGVAYGRAMAASLGAEDVHRSFRSALHAVADALTAHGFAAHAEAAAGGGARTMQIVSDHCPFGAAATASPVLCAVDRGMVKGMLAAIYGETSPQTAQSRARGDALCVTAITPRPA